MTNLLNLKSNNSTQLQMSALHSVLTYGDTLAPRGKVIKEMRPSVIEFTDPYDRIPQLENRRLNVFFHAAEVIWVTLGRSDVEFLTAFNTNMATFSDDGVHFNAPYGERLRSWGKHDATDDIYNPLDQLYSAWRMLAADPDTRQATATIGDPRYDNADYLLNGGLDSPCNRELYFKIRQGKLDLTVANRSSDINWGLFAANLPVFTTLQELVAGWLDIEPGVYTQMSDSVHVYLDDYGADLNDKLTGVYGPADAVTKYVFKEPRIRPRSYKESSDMLLRMETVIERVVLDEAIIVQAIEARETTLDNVISEVRHVIDDPYFEMLTLLMLIYRIHANDAELEPDDDNSDAERRLDTILSLLEALPESTWKRGALSFLATSERYPEADRKIFGDLRDELDASAAVQHDKIMIVGGDE